MKQICLSLPVLSLFLTACQPHFRPGQATLVLARGADSQKLDPADVDDGESVNVLNNICEGLVRFKTSTAEM